MADPTFDEWLDELRQDAHDRGDHLAQRYCQEVRAWQVRAEYAERTCQQLRVELERYRATATIGGPPPKVTPCWEPGDSSRPSTAPPEPQVVELPEGMDVDVVTVDDE